MTHPKKYMGIKNASLSFNLAIASHQAGQETNTSPSSMRHEVGMKDAILVWLKRQGNASQVKYSAELGCGQENVGLHTGRWWSEPSTLGSKARFPGY